MACQVEEEEEGVVEARHPCLEEGVEVGEPSQGHRAAVGVVEEVEEHQSLLALVEEVAVEVAVAEALTLLCKGVEVVEEVAVVEERHTVTSEETWLRPVCPCPHQSARPCPP